MFVVHVTIVDVVTGASKTISDIPVLKGTDRATRKEFLAEAFARLFEEITKEPS